MNGVANHLLANADVFAFDRPHRIGSVCAPEGCEQCGDLRRLIILDAFNNTLPPTPMKILAEATEEDWRQKILADGGSLVGVHPDPGDHFYFVSVD